MTQSTRPEVRQVRLDELPGLVGTTLGTSGSMLIGQEQIDGFAEVTRDHQWLHVDPKRAATGPFGTTIAHGFLTLALGTALLWEIIEVTDAAQVVNYGLNKVRFPAPVPVGSQVSLTVDLLALDSIGGGFQATLGATFRVAGQPKPVCVAEVLFRYYRA